MRLRDSKQHTQVQTQINIASESDSIKFPRPCLYSLHHCSSNSSLLLPRIFIWKQQQKNYIESWWYLPPCQNQGRLLESWKKKSLETKTGPILDPPTCRECCPVPEWWHCPRSISTEGRPGIVSMFIGVWMVVNCRGPHLQLELMIHIEGSAVDMAQTLLFWSLGGCITCSWMLINDNYNYRRV